jgi:hypothetical protein
MPAGASPVMLQVQPSAISENVRAFYNTTVIDSADGLLAALLAHQSELTRIRDTIKTMEDGYRRTEGDHAALWGRQA